MWLLLVLFILVLLVYLGSTYFCQGYITPLQQPIQEDPVTSFDILPVEISLEMREPIFTEIEVCTTRDAVFVVESHSLS